MAGLVSSLPAGFMPLQSGIVVPVPAAEPIVGDARRRLNAQALYGVPAHITCFTHSLIPPRLTP